MAGISGNKGKPSKGGISGKSQRGFGSGKARGSRGTGRGKGYQGGWAGGGGSSGQAQSGGRATTFAGGKGGNNNFTPAGGSRGQNVEGTGVNSAGNRYRIRNASGDATTTKAKLPRPEVTNLLGMTGGQTGKTNTSIVYPTAVRGAARGRGGSNQ